MTAKDIRDRQAAADPRWADPVLVKTLYPHLDAAVIRRLLLHAEHVRLRGGGTLASALGR